MRFTIVLGAIFIALVFFGRLWISNNSHDAASPVAAPSETIAEDSSQGGPVEQVIQRVVPKGPQSPAIVSQVWLNSPPLATQDLRGKVVVVEFWTHG